MPAPFSHLRRRLVVAGVSPRYARRLAAELADHLRALEEDVAADRDLSPEQAAAIARERLGSEDEIIVHVLRSGGFRALSRRRPALVYVLLPLLLLPLVLLVITAVLAIFVPGIESIAEAGSKHSALHRLTLAYSSLLVPSTAAAMTGLFVMVARQCQCRILWPLLSSIVLALLSSIVFVEAALPSDGAPGLFAVGMTLPTPSLYAFLPLSVALLLGLLLGLPRRVVAPPEVTS